MTNLIHTIAQRLALSLFALTFFWVGAITAPVPIPAAGPDCPGASTVLPSGTIECWDAP